MTKEHRADKRKIFIFASFTAALLGVGALIFLNIPKIEDRVACTTEAKICPDGSAVGRSGPDCKFAECPTPAVDSSWSSFSDPLFAISFRYPDKLPTKYISVVDWPPVARSIDEPFSCSNAGSETARAGISEGKVISGRSYCVTRESEGAAGSIYTNYAYKTVKNNETIVLTFSLRSVQCANYDEPKRSECLKERSDFNIDPIVDGIMSSLRVGSNLR